MCCSHPIQFAKRDRGQGFSSHEALEAGTVAALRGWRIAEVGPSGEPPITPPACKLQVRQKNLSPWIQTANDQPRVHTLHRSTLSPILPLILHALLIADAVYCAFIPVPCRPLTQAVTCPTFTFLGLLSESPSDQSIGQLAWPPQAHDQPRLSTTSP
jgi:hypothetical protein